MGYLGKTPSPAPLTSGDIPDLATSKITSGTFADARISVGSVTQHVTATDLQPIKSDLTALAIREATNEASAAFNLPSSFIETFTDDTNLGTQTTGDRTSGYWASVVGTVVPTNTVLYVKSNLANGSQVFTDHSSVGRTLSAGGDVHHDDVQEKIEDTSMAQEII